MYSYLSTTFVREKMTALDPSKQGIEAQKLISISLGKMAASRVGKGGSSLHKSLLVASVLHRARHVFLEENYHNYHYRGQTIAPLPMYGPHLPPPPPGPPSEDNDENRCSTPIPHHEQDASATLGASEEGVAVPRMPLGDASNQQQQQQRAVALKRRRCVSDKETQDAVSSILPKRFRSSSTSESTSPTVDDETSSLKSCANENVLVPISVSENAFLSVCATEECSSPVCASENNAMPEGARDSTTTNNPIYCTLEPISDDEDDDDDVNSMEVEHITSLVSIFSFGAPRKDLCATQAAREEPAQFTPVALAV